MCRLYPKDNEFELLLRKGFYPYEYMDSADRMSETCLPHRDEFFSQLTDEHITDADSQTCPRCGTTFGMRKMKEYHDL